MSDAGPEDARRFRMGEAAQEMYDLLKRLAFGAYDSAKLEVANEARALLARIDGKEPT